MHAYPKNPNPLLPPAEDDTPSKPTAVIAPADAYEPQPEAQEPATNGQHVMSPMEEDAGQVSSDMGQCARALYDYQACKCTSMRGS